jgi:hypothetical protein
LCSRPNTHHCRGFRRYDRGRELFRRDIALDGPRHDAFAECHFGLEKLAVERRRADVIIPIALVQPGAKPRNST